MRNSTQVAEGVAYILWHPFEVSPFALFCAVMVVLPVVVLFLGTFIFTVVDWIKAPRHTPEQILRFKESDLFYRQSKATKKKELVESKKLKRAEDKRQRAQQAEQAERMRRKPPVPLIPQAPAIGPPVPYREIDYPKDGLWHLDREPMATGFPTAVDANVHAKASWPGERFRLLPPIFS